MLGAALAAAGCAGPAGGTAGAPSAATPSAAAPSRPGVALPAGDGLVLQVAHVGGHVRETGWDAGPVDVEPVTPTAPRAAGRTVFTQGWRDVAFLHWAVEPARVAPLLPAGTRPDEHDGVTYVGLIPFRMRRIGLLGTPGLPYLGSFLELNVRLYSVDGAGRRGVVFRSLEADRLLPVLAARWIAGLPYLFARMSVDRDGDVLRWSSHRRWPGPRGARARIAVRVGDPMPDPPPLARFLTARWGLHQPDRRGRTLYWPNEHPEWPLHAAGLVELDDDLVATAGLPGLGGAPDSVLFSPGVDVRFGPRIL